MRSYIILAALLFVSFGFTSASAENNLASNIPSEYNIQTNPALIDRPFSLDQIPVISPFDFRDNIANMLAIFLLAIPFGAIVYRLSNGDPIPLKYSKLSSVVVFFALFSMMTTPIGIGNSFWGYAFANSDAEINIPEPIDSLYFDTSDSNFSNKGGISILNNKNSAILLDGQNHYLVLDSILPEKLKQFSVSAWVKPDYKKGAPATLSVVSEANAFDLSINNNKVDKNFAIFLAYCTIKICNL